MNFWIKLADNYKIVIPVVILVVYLQVLTFNLSFFQDNKLLIDNFERINSFGNVLDEFVQSYPLTNEYKPLTMISYHFNALFSGQSTYSYHLLNMILLICLTLLLFKTLGKLSKNNIFNLLFSILFSIHPLLIYNISWIPGRDKLLTALFGLLSFYMLLKYLENLKNSNIIISSITLLLSFLSDSSGVSFLFINCIYYLFINKSDNAHKKLISISYFSAFIFYIILYFIYLNFNAANFTLQSKMNSGYIINLNYFYINFRNLMILAETIGAFFFPFKINNLSLFSNLRIFIGSAALISLIILYFLKFKTNKNYLLGILIIFAAFVPEIIFSKFYFNNYFGFSFGFPLLIIIGLLISFSSIVKDSFFENKNNTIFIFLIFLILSITNFIYSKNFSSAKLFYESQYQSNPENVDFLNSLVELEIKSGNINEAESLLRTTEIESSKLSKSLILMGDYYYSNKNYALAIPFLEKATSNNEKNINALNLLANCYFNNKQFDKAENILLPLSKQTDKYPDARWDLLNIFMELKDFDKANSYINENFNFVNDKMKLLELINSWSRIYFQEKDNVAVVKSMKLGLVIDPDNAVILNYLYDTYTKIGLKDKAAIYEKRLKQIFNEQESGKIK